MHRPFPIILRGAAAVAITVSALLTTTAGSDAATPRAVKRIVAQVAADTAVPPSIALAVASIESGFRDDFESATGTRGVMQISPEVAETYGVSPKALWDARRNTELGLRILSDYFRSSEHQWPVALRRYAKTMPGGYAPGKFARKVLRLERRFAEEIVTRKALEKRKREVLNVAENGDYYFGPSDANPTVAKNRHQNVRVARIISPNVVQSVRAKAAKTEAFDTNLARRLAKSRRSLDDFSAGLIPDHLMRRRSHTGLAR